MHLKYFVFCGLDKGNWYFAIEIQLEYILCNWIMMMMHRA